MIGAGTEAIYAALFMLVSSNPAFTLTSRIFEKWDNVPTSSQPALFQRQGSIGVSEQVTFGLPKQMFRASWWIYCQYSPDSGTIPAQTLNGLIDAAKAAILPTVPGDLQTLGGLVTNAYIQGEILVNEGVLPGDTQSIAVLPILIVTGV